MTGQRDIERTLDAWFVDGPSVMPDRLFDAVLDQVERTPQTPLARLRLRLTDMNPRIRWLTAAAAGMATVLVAMTLINRPADGDVGASLSPSPIPTASGVAVPAELVGSWHGETKAVPGIDEGAGATLWFSSTEFWVTPSNAADTTLFRSDLRASAEGRFEVETPIEGRGCAAGDSGAYTWTLSTSGRTLTVAADLPDQCAPRSEAAVGTWWFIGCEDTSPDAACLGDLDAGAYASEYFDPFVAVGESWQARFGALRYTVPAGWTNRADWPADYRLAPEGAPDTTALTLVSDVVVASRADNCTEAQDPEAGTTAEAMVAALPRPGLSVSTPEEVTIGGLTGYRVDLALRDSWATACPWSGGRPYVLLFVDRPAEAGFAWGLEGETRMRTYFLDIAPDRALFIAIEAATEAEQLAFADEASAVVETFDFTP